MNRVYYMLRQRIQHQRFIKFPIIKSRKYSTLQYNSTNNNNNNNNQQDDDNERRIVFLLGFVMYYIYSRKIR